MITNTPDQIDWLFSVFGCLFRIMFLYEAWTNLVKNQVSQFSIDALLWPIILSVSRPKVRKRIVATQNDPRRLTPLSLIASLAGISFLYGIIEWFRTYTLH
ncbi:MAG TPA: hypothetical protein VLX61_06265 [Anaerolineales bacterium]|nr:hypothetical protein [Anaerolineales bacterium]